MVQEIALANSIFLQHKYIKSRDINLFNNFTINYIKRLIKGEAGNIYYSFDEGYKEDSVNILTLTEDDTF